jgi:hypothetical protein
MSRLKYVLLIVIVTIALSGCSTKNNLETPAETLTVQSPAGYVNPYPIEETPASSENIEIQENQSTGNQAYPDPESVSEIPSVAMHPENFVNDLVVPAPSSGLAVITGQLMSAGETNKPYIATLYLASVKQDDDPSHPPEINFSAKSDPMAIQDIETGNFVFKDVNPGQYAIVVWSPGKSFFLKDASGTTIIVEGKADEVNDLGVISFNK